MSESDQRNSCRGESEAKRPRDAAPDQRAAGDVRHIFVVEGLDCAEEVSVLRRAIGPIVGGDENLAFDVLNGRMMVLQRAPAVSVEQISDAVSRTGMSARPWRRGQGASDQQISRRKQQVLFTTASGASLLCAVIIHAWMSGGLLEFSKLFSAHAGSHPPIAELAAYALAIGFGVRFVLISAFNAAMRLQADMNLLMVIAVSGAMYLGEWFEAAAVSFLFALSLALESWSIGRARQAISALLDLAPPQVRVRSLGGIEREFPVEAVSVGTRFIVRPGDRIALDGNVVSGSSSVNQAPITGESMPVLKEWGSEVYAGTINGDGALEIESTKLATDTTLSRIIRMVEQAQSRRAESEQWVERFARIYTPSVIILALLVLVVPPLVGQGLWNEWFHRALVLLVIACPCALVISTPVSIVASLAAAARQGVLVKGGMYIELPAKLRALAFDKTGTITRGEPDVVAVIPLNGHTKNELLQRALALEARSSHPLALAVQRYCAERGIRSTSASDVQILLGKGVTGTHLGEFFWLGSHRYVVERGQDSDEIAKHARACEEDGWTVVAIGNEKHVCGLLAFADRMRDDIAAIIDQLRQVGVEHLVMLTGDNETTANAVAREAGVTEVHAELLPGDKVSAIESLVERYTTVAMIGDGVNDAPAMARASFGIAMGAVGSDAAIETADVALMNDDLSKVPWLISHSRRTLRTIWQNIVFSLGVKIVFVLLTFAGFASLWGAIAADVGATLIVVANALRLLKS